MITVIKRNGEHTPFDSNKIIYAVERANEEVAEEEKALDYEIENIVNEVIRTYKDEGICTVEEIQDLVEQGLMSSGRYVLARKYMAYRLTHTLIRRVNTTDDVVLSLVQNENEEVATENSNKNTRLNSTQRDLIAGEISKDLAKRTLLPTKLVKAHEEGALHFHDMDYFIQPMFNCFSGETKFVTNKGCLSFNTFKDGEAVKIVNKYGEWENAIVRNYGKQIMYDIRLKSGKMERTITATKNHRWLLVDGSETTELKVGDRLSLLVERAPIHISTKRQAEMWALGFIIGDGYDNEQGLRCRLCGEKTKYLDIFIKAGYGWYNQDLDIGVYKTTKMSKQSFLDNAIWNYLDKEDIEYLIDGLYTADGSTDRNLFCTSDERVATLFENVSSVGGYYISSKRTISHSTNYKKDAVLYEYHFIKSQRSNYAWKVEEITPHDKANRPMEAWCVETEHTKTFTLEGGIVTGNCCLVNIKDMLDNGTVMNGKLIESPKSFQVACTVMTQVIASVASNQYGGQSVATKHLAPYLRKSREKYLRILSESIKDKDMLVSVADALTKKELSSGIQTIQYQINTLMTTNGQSPFVTLFMQIDEGSEYEEEQALIVEEILKQRIEGIKNEKGVSITPPFPKLIYVLDEHNCLKGGKYDYLTKLAVKCSSKRMYPDYISAKKMRENYNGEVFSCMGCRSFLSPWKDENGDYKWEGRFNQGVVSINLPQVAILSRGNEMKFWQLLEERLGLCFEALMLRHNRLLGTLSDVSPIHFQHGAIARLNKGEKIDKLLKNGYSTISLGYIGLYEVTKLMKGVSHTTEEGKEFALRVMNYLKDTCEKWKKATGLGFGLYGTPAESLCYRFARIDKARFGEIEDITDKGYYTNSYHVDVREDIDAFSKLAFESQFQSISSGGAISYVEIPNVQNNVEVLESLVSFIYENIQYAEFNTKSDFCLSCGYSGEIVLNKDYVWECPQCKEKRQAFLNVTRRTCGYLGENFWNKGKTMEISQRKLHL